MGSLLLVVVWPLELEGTHQGYGSLLCSSMLLHEPEKASSWFFKAAWLVEGSDSGALVFRGRLWAQGWTLRALLLVCLLSHALVAMGNGGKHKS